MAASIFDLLTQVVRATSDEVWEHVETAEPGLSISRLDCGGVSFYRAQYAIDIPFSKAAVLARPDVFYHPRRPEFDAQIAECTVEEALSPWDCVCTTRYSFSNEKQRFTSLMGAPKISAAVVAHAGGDIVTTTNRVQMAVRRDMPRQGMLTAMIVPVHPETEECCPEWGMIRARGIILEPHEDPGRALVTEVRHIRGLPNWALAMGAGHSLKCHQWITDFVSSDVFRDAAKGASSYIVLGVRKCVRGMPLLPCEHRAAGGPDVYTWEPSEPVVATLAAYLRTFLQRIGAAAEEFHESLEGRRLAWYQVVVRLGAWERAWRALEEPYLQQKSAYRWFFGGSVAPVFKVGIKPKFLESATAPSCQARHHTPVRDTFVHFGPASCADMWGDKGRANSDFGLPSG